MFEETFVCRGKTNRPWTLLVAFTGELVLVGIAVLTPLIYLQALPRAQLTNAISLAPPPPPPPPTRQASVPRIAKVIPRQFVVGHLTAPVTAPKQVASLTEQEFAAPSDATGVVDGVPGGVPGGQIGGVIGGIIGSTPSVAPPVPPPPPAPNEPKTATSQRIRVGGNLQASRLLHQVAPAYPWLAKSGRIQGVVRFNAVIGEDGRVRNLTLISGQPLLVPAAMQAVEQFMYQPAYLNGQPVEVETEIDVKFHLTY